MADMVDRDEEHLRLLRYGYYVLAAYSGLLALLPLVFVGIGVFLRIIPPTARNANAPDPKVMGMLFIMLGLLFFALGALATWMNILVAFSLRDRRRRTLCFITAALTCLWIPWGTLLGIATLMVLERPRVKAMFPPPGSPPPLP